MRFRKNRRHPRRHAHAWRVVSRIDGDEPRFANPIVKQRADPFVVRHTDGFTTSSRPCRSTTASEIRRAPTIQELGAAEAKVVWRKHENGAMGSHIWAPELHHHRWNVVHLFRPRAARKKSGHPHLRSRLRRRESARGRVDERGQLKTGLGVVLARRDDVHATRRALPRLGAAGSEDPGNSNLYIARMGSPTSIVGLQIMISKPDLPWE